MLCQGKGLFMFLLLALRKLFFERPAREIGLHCPPLGPLTDVAKLEEVFDIALPCCSARP